MRYKKIFDYIMSRADVEEYEILVMALNAITKLSPKALGILKHIIDISFSGSVSASKAKETIEKTKFELATYIYF